MRRGREQSEFGQGLPVYEIVDAQTPQQAATQPAIDQQYDSPKPDIIYTQEAWERLRATAVSNVSREHARLNEIDRAFLQVLGRPQTSDRRAIAAGPAGQNRRELASSPHRASGQATNGRTAAFQQPSQHTPQTSSAEEDLSAVQEWPGSKWSKWSREHKNVLVGAAAAAAIVGVGAMAAAGKNSGEAATGATITAMGQPASELRTDTLTCGTPFATTSFNTGQNVEAHIPVEIKGQAGHDAYVSIKIQQFGLPNMALTACGILDPKTKASPVWARLNKDNDQYTVNRSVIQLSSKPWTQTLQKTDKGTIPESQVLTNIASAILPTPGTGLALYLDGKPVADADRAKYVITKQPSVLKKDISNPKQPRLFYDPAFVKELVMRMQIETLRALDDPNQCSQVVPALDKASAANIMQQNNLPKNVTINFDNKSSYVEASAGFNALDEVKTSLAPSAIKSIGGFSLSCPVEPVLPKTSNNVKPSATPKTTATVKK